MLVRPELFSAAEPVVSFFLAAFDETGIKSFSCFDVNALTVRTGQIDLAVFHEAMRSQCPETVWIMGQSSDFGKSEEGKERTRW